MTKHFRLELNIGNEKPLPRILEDKRGEDDLISETDPREKFPITEAEKPKIEQTRAQVTNWFGVWERCLSAVLTDQIGSNWLHKNNITTCLCEYEPMVLELSF